MNLGRLQNKIAVITGAASGIGKATCIRFAEEGASIVAVDINLDGLSETIALLNNAEGLKHLSFCGDVSDVPFVKKVFKDAKVAFNTDCDVLINCAGIGRAIEFVNLEPEMFDETIRINLKGVFVMTKEFVSTLELDETQPKAISVVNIASIAGKVPSDYPAASYCTSKAGVIGFTQSVGKQLAKFGIRCNAILPAFINTPMLHGLSEEQRSHITGRTPMKRLGEPREIANACLFLSSDESSYVNCASLEVTGGYVC